MCSMERLEKSSSIFLLTENKFFEVKPREKFPPFLSKEATITQCFYSKGKSLMNILPRVNVKQYSEI